MRKHSIKFLFSFAFIILLCTCNDPVFYAISQEVKPIPPRIEGSPSNFTMYNNRMYVASGTVLYSYNKGTSKPYWQNEIQPGGNIYKLASANTGKYLYALCSTDSGNNGRTVIKYFDKTNFLWTQISGIYDVHDIFEANGIIFFYATFFKNNYNIYYTVFYIDSSGIPKQLITQNPELQNDMGEIIGAAWNGTSYFLLTTNRGVYKIDDLATGAVLIYSPILFSGIINLEDTDNTIFLIARNGDAYVVDNFILPLGISMSTLATGALAIWRENDSSPNWLLLLGRQDSLSYSVSFGYKYGYLELVIDDGGIVVPGFSEPGRSPLSSVKWGGNERYQSSLGKQPIKYLFQAPSDIDPNMTLFASTQKSGVWSYRERGSAYLFQWNAEGANEP